MDLSICLIAKNEREGYLKEWLNYHFLSGVDFVCIYDNESSIPIQNILSETKNIAPGVYQGKFNERLVEVVSWPGKYVQSNAYSNFIERYRNKVKWAAFIDADEFIVSKCGNIKKNLAGHGGFGGLGLNWRIFGSNNLQNNETNSQIYAFTKRSKDDFLPNRHIKTIAQLNFTAQYITPHHFSYIGNYFCANELGHPCFGPHANFTAQYIYINHYYTRSHIEYQQKLIKGRADCAASRSPISDYDKNEIEDFTLVELYEKLKSNT